MCCALSLVLASAAFAEEPEEPIDDAHTVIVYRSDGLPRVAGSAHVIEEDELDATTYDDIGRVLAQVPGVYVRGEEGFGLRPNIGMRGANADRSKKIALLQDGIPLAPAPYAAPAAYYFPLMARVVGVEVFKGPAATRHGPQTIGGAVNLLTRPVPRHGSGGEVDLGMGRWDTTRVHGWAGSGTDRGGLLAEIAHLRTDGFKRLDTGGPTGFDRTDLFLATRLRLAPGQSLHLASDNALERSRETYLGLHGDDYAVDPDRRYAASDAARLDMGRSAQRLEHRVTRGGVELRTVAYHQILDRSWTKVEGFVDGRDLPALLEGPDRGTASIYLDVLRGATDSSPGTSLVVGTNARRYRSLGLESRLRWTTGRHRLEAGARLHADRVDRHRTVRPYAMAGGAPLPEGAPSAPVVERDRATALSVHLHDELQIGALHLHPGMRLETVRAYRMDVEAPRWRTAVLPGFGASVDAGPETALFAGLHRGISPVAPGQSTAVSPESSLNLEVGARSGDALRNAELVFFINRYSNLAGQCSLSSGCDEAALGRQYDAGEALVGGVESTARAELLLPRGLSIPLRASATFSEGRFLTSFTSAFPAFGTVRRGDALPDMPRFQGSARLGLHHRTFRIDGAMSARSGFRSRAGRGALGPTDVPAQVLVDLALHLPVDRVLEAYVRVTNLLDQRPVAAWRPFGARPTPPRQILIGMKAARPPG